MATKGKSKKSSMTTKTGKTRLGPLNLKQLEDLSGKSSKPKEKAKIDRRINELKSRTGYIKPVEAIVEEIVEAVTK